MASAAVSHLLQAARAARELDAFFLPLDDLADDTGVDLAQLGVLARSPCMGGSTHLGGLYRVWYKDIRWTLLLQSILLNSAWANGLARPSLAKDLSTHSGLSVPAVLLAIRDGKSTGDFVATRFSADKRVNVLDPSPAVIELSTALRSGYLQAVQAHHGRGQPFQPADLRVERAWRRIYLDLVLNRIAFDRDRSRNLVAAQRIFTLWPIVLGERHGYGDFVDLVARGAQLSPQTVRNRIQWLRQHGWLQDTDSLAATPMAMRRFRALASLFWQRGRLVLDLLDALNARPELADALSLDTSARSGEMATFLPSARSLGLRALAY